jgi:hypothetical protein
MHHGVVARLKWNANVDIARLIRSVMRIEGDVNDV